MGEDRNTGMAGVDSVEKIIRDIPKAELHVHLEGTLEPDLMFDIAKRNGVKLTHSSVEELRSSYSFENLEDFLRVYFEGSRVLLRELDFFEVTMAYLLNARSQNVLRAEMFFAPQAHTRKGVGIEQVISGIHEACLEAENSLGISTAILMCFLRELGPDQAMETLELALPFKDWITGVGLGSVELGNPPGAFREVFDRARSEGFETCAHAGEEGPAEYIREAVEQLKVSRIDHGNRVLEDESLVEMLAQRRIPLTLCPLSNVKLKVVHGLENYPIEEMCDRGLVVTVNSDDPAYFGGYINENFVAVQQALGLDCEWISTLAKNSFEASFLDRPGKDEMFSKLTDYWNLIGREAGA